MAFQFLCPQGHLLQGEPWQAGQQSMCPYCRSVFIIPSPQGITGPGASASGGVSPGGVGGTFPQGGAQAGMAGIWSGPTAPGGGRPYDPGGNAPAAWPGMAPAQESMAVSAPPQEAFSGGFPQGPSSAESRWPPAVQEPAETETPGISPGTVPLSPMESPLLHVLCPSGHELETPREMLGQEAICPFCQVQFRLRWEDSVEYRREKQLEVERRLARQSRLWMQWSIAAAVAVVIGVIVMIVIAASH